MTPDKVEAALGVLAESERLLVAALYAVAADKHREALSVLTEALADYRELQLAVWKARAILGFDNDGDETPDALTYPSLAELVVRDAQEFRNDYDAAAKG